MSFWKGIVNYFKRESKSDMASARTGAVPLFVYGGASAMCVATVFRCVKLLSESVAGLPFQYLRVRDGIYIPEEEGEMNYLLNVRPDLSVNAFDFRCRVVQNVLLDGNAYIVPFYDGPEIIRLALCNRGTVGHDTLTDTYNISDPTNGVFGVFSEDEVIHIKGLTGIDGKRGISVLAYARLTTQIAATGDQETHNRFANGGNVRGIVSNDKSVRGFGEYQDKELAKTAVDIDSRFQSGERIVSLPGQVEFSPISLSSTDMQFLESRKFTVREICRFFGVHPSFVFDDTSNNYKSAEQANAAFLSHTLAPLLRSIEAEFDSKLIAPALHGKRKFRFDLRELHSCDLTTLMSYREKLLQTGTSLNEVRKMENLPAVPGGDVVLVSANLRGLNEVRAQ